jgi:hypothetical protein
MILPIADRHDPAARCGGQDGDDLCGQSEVAEMVGSHGQLEALPVVGGRP